MEKFIEVIKDLIKCIIWGSIISLGIILVVGIISLLVPNVNWRQSLQNVRSALLLIGALGMILGALLILKKRGVKELSFIDQWKDKYSVFSYRIVLIVVSITIILYGGFIDWLIIAFKIIS
ncbi:hypothetical protein [Clostridium tertium]|uniref:Uncharacterized protein n=1 Tax=Clostridium tertium TaxID=1559 RepID=A0A6N3AXF4_9CLOT